MLRPALIAAGLCLGISTGTNAQEPLRLENTIRLGVVAGRIDHLAIDLAQRRLFVAELGNNAVDIVDLNASKRVERLTVKQPQGLGYVASTRTLFVSSAADGTVQAIREHDAVPAAKIHLGSDADNIRVAGDRVYVGYGDGAIAAIDAARYEKIADIVLPEHPEGFELDGEARQLFVNLPDAHCIVIADLAVNKVASQISTQGRGANFPLAIDAQRILVAFRNPPQLVAYAKRGAAEQAAASVCNDADDLFVDAKRQRAYVSCGDGHLDVFAIHGEKLERIAHLLTATGARTSLFVPELDRLFLAVRATAAQPAAIWVYEPVD